MSGRGLADILNSGTRIEPMQPRRRFSHASLMALNEVDPRLVVVAATALQLGRLDFRVLEGVRSEVRQRELYERGASWTLDSRHLSGDAIDCMVLDPETGIGTWESELYEELHREQFAPAFELHGIPYVWGGHWRTRDLGHWQVERGGDFPDLGDAESATRRWDATHAMETPATPSKGEGSGEIVDSGAIMEVEMEGPAPAGALFEPAGPRWQCMGCGRTGADPDTLEHGPDCENGNLVEI